MGVYMFPQSYGNWFMVWKDENGKLRSNIDGLLPQITSCQRIADKMEKSCEEPQEELLNVLSATSAYNESLQNYLSLVYEEGIKLARFQPGDVIKLKKPYSRSDTVKILDICGVVGEQDKWGINHELSCAYKCVVLKKDGSESKSVVTVQNNDILEETK